MGKSTTHKDLDIWKRGIEFDERIYKITADFPREEIYGLVSQLRRAAISYPSNIAEGAARSSKKEYIQYLYISLASLSEIETQLIISKRLDYLKGNDLFEEIDNNFVIYPELINCYVSRIFANSQLLLQRTGAN